MYSTKHKEKVLAVIRSPLIFCEKLQLNLTHMQHALLERLGARPKLLEVAADAGYEVARAVGAAVVWRILDTPGSNCIVLAPTEDAAGDFMTYLEAITKRRNAELAQVVTIPNWKTIQFGASAGWEIKVLRNRPKLIRQKAPDAIMSVILDARNTDSQFFEACNALEESATHPQHSMVKIW